VPALMIAAAETGQQGDVSLIHLITVVQRILSGKIH
jgi:hypothetical protein